MTFDAHTTQVPAVVEPTRDPDAYRHPDDDVLLATRTVVDEVRRPSVDFAAGFENRLYVQDARMFRESAVSAATTSKLRELAACLVRTSRHCASRPARIVGALPQTSESAPLGSRRVRRSLTERTVFSDTPSLCRIAQAGTCYSDKTRSLTTSSRRPGV